MNIYFEQHSHFTETIRQIQEEPDERVSVL